MLRCRPVDDYNSVIAFLRRDVFSNNCILDALEHDVPPVPRTVYVAEEAGEICGVMSVEDFGQWVVADLRAAGGRAEAVALLTRQLDPNRTYRFSVGSQYWDAVRLELAEPHVPSAVLAMTVTQDGWRLVDGPGDVRKLTCADRALTDAYPLPAQRHQPTLTQFVEMAALDPDRVVVFGSLLAGEIAAYLELNLVVDRIWEVGMIETREQWRGRALAKQLLSEASRELLAEGRSILYQVSGANVASQRTACAVGYRETFRVLAMDGKLK
ncbi:MAG: GNAT family N-acetyltransferase [Armatimonadia bacterium]